LKAKQSDHAFLSVHCAVNRKEESLVRKRKTCLVNFNSVKCCSSYFLSYFFRTQFSQEDARAHRTMSGTLDKFLQVSYHRQLPASTRTKIKVTKGTKAGVSKKKLNNVKGKTPVDSESSDESSSSSSSGSSGTEDESQAESTGPAEVSAGLKRPRSKTPHGRRRSRQSDSMQRFKDNMKLVASQATTALASPARLEEERNAQLNNATEDVARKSISVSLFYCAAAKILFALMPHNSGLCLAEGN
jgi:hypothetical protein